MQLLRMYPLWVTLSVKALLNLLSRVSSFLKSYDVLEPGDSVKTDEIIARIETDKVTVDILAAFTGVIT
jgi:glycine cleavage system H lipoate-binding protein